VWNGKSIRLVLDHANGVKGDNRPTNLRLLCPNCNSQQSTHAGANKGRVIESSGGFARVEKDGKKHYTLPAEAVEYRVSGGAAELNAAKKRA
jgi:hypothetical protein